MTIDTYMHLCQKDSDALCSPKDFLHVVSSYLLPPQVLRLYPCTNGVLQWLLELASCDDFATKCTIVDACKDLLHDDIDLSLYDEDIEIENDGDLCTLHLYFYAMLALKVKPHLLSALLVYISRLKKSEILSGNLPPFQSVKDATEDDLLRLKVLFHTDNNM